MNRSEPHRRHNNIPGRTARNRQPVYRSDATPYSARSYNENLPCLQRRTGSGVFVVWSRLERAPRGRTVQAVGILQQGSTPFVQSIARSRAIIRVVTFKSYYSPREAHFESERTNFSAVGRFGQAQFRADSVSRHVDTVPAPPGRRHSIGDDVVCMTPLPLSRRQLVNRILLYRIYRCFEFTVSESRPVLSGSPVDSWSISPDNHRIRIHSDVSLG